jgi:hypothetical protein
MTVAICSTQLTTLEQTIAFINYHKKIGVNLIFIFYDNPYDDIISKVEGMEVVTAIPCDDDYWLQHKGRPNSIEKRQNINSDHAVRLCRELNIDWLLHIDVDEFFHYDLRGTISEYFAMLDDNIVTVRFPVCESIPTKIEHFNFLNEINSFRCHPISYRNNVKMTTKQKLAIKYDLFIMKIKRAIMEVTGLEQYAKYGFMKAYIAGKSATRVNASITSMGLHSSKIKYLPHQYGVVSKNSRILHFDAFSFEAWFQKWLKRLDGRGTSTSMHDERQRQLLDFEKHYNSNNNDALLELYQQIYFIDKKGRSILKKLGLIKSFKFNEHNENVK